MHSCYFRRRSCGCHAIRSGTRATRPQTVTLMKVDPQTLATGYRSSKIVGSTVVNDANQTVGSIDDLIITPGGQAPYAVLSVGGFLGLARNTLRCLSRP